MRALVVLAVWCAAATAEPLRIAGGSYTTIDKYPSIAAFSSTTDMITYTQHCGGAILNNRAVLTAAHCLREDSVIRSRVRLGSTFSNSGGTLYRLSKVIIHPTWDTFLLYGDIAIVHTDVLITYNDVVQPGFFAGANYHVPDDASVWAAGWGATYHGGAFSEQLKHVELFYLNLEQCKVRWGQFVNDDMICARSFTDENGQCSGDSGSPLYHNNVVIGVLSAGGICGSIADPTISSSVTRYISWIQENA